MIKIIIFGAAVIIGGVILHHGGMAILKRKPQIANIILNFDKLLK